MSLSSAPGNVSTAKVAMVVEETKKSWQPRKHYNTNILESIKLEVGNYAKVYGTKVALDEFQKKYSKHVPLNLELK